MKVKASLTVLFLVAVQFAGACPVCEKQQPAVTRGITHGAGPQSNWDWVIIVAITLLTVITLVLSLKYLLSPGEKRASHIKQLILESK